MTPAPAFTIPEHFRKHPLWIALVDHYTARLASLRAQNDAPKPPDETARLRGQIAEVKAFLSLAEDSPPVP